MLSHLIIRDVGISDFVSVDVEFLGWCHHHILLLNLMVVDTNTIITLMATLHNVIIHIHFLVIFNN